MVLLAACTSPDTGSRRVIVNAIAGDRVAAGVTVVSHAVNGTLIDQVVADDSGRALLVVDDDVLVSVVFPAVIEPSTTVHVVTTLAPDAELTIYGPPDHSRPEPIVGVLNVNGPALPGATVFDIDLGCTRVSVASLPATIDVGACSLGTDDKLDVLVRGGVTGDVSFWLEGYAAGRLALTNGAATFDIAEWKTAPTDAPLTIDAAGASLALSVYADGLLFDTQDLTDHASLWDGLIADTTRVTASIAGDQGSRVTVRDFNGVPQALTFTETDFLPPIAPSLTLSSLNPLSLRWEPTPLGDAVNVQASWNADGVGTRNATVWDAVLPPESTTVTFPVLVDALAIATSRAEVQRDYVSLRYLDDEAYDGFAPLAAAGLRVGDTDTPVPRENAFRLSQAFGLR